MHFLLASSWLDPLVGGISSIVLLINAGVHNLGLSLILLAALIRLVFWPLNTAQFKSMMAMQKIAPKLKKLQERYKKDPQKLQQEQMALYKNEGVNPLAGCWPLLVQMPIIFSVYWVVKNNQSMYDSTSFLWIGSALSAHSPVLFGQPLFAASLAHADVLLLVIYMVTQYISMRFASMPATDPAQAQQMKIMQAMSPVMIGVIGFRGNWPSAMVLYWLCYNLFTMGQQFYLIRRYHEPISFLDSDHAITADVPATDPVAEKKKLPAGNGAVKTYKVKKKTKGANS